MNVNARRNLFAALFAICIVAGIALFQLQHKGPKVVVDTSYDAASAIAPELGVVVDVPDLGRLGERLSMLTRLKLAQLGASMLNAPSAEAVADEAARQVGFDVRSRDSMKGAGIDPSRPLLFAESLDGNRAIAAIPMSDAAKFDALVAKHASARLAAGRRAEIPGAQGNVVTFSTEQGTIALAYGQKGGYALLSAGPGAVDMVNGALARKKEGSIAADKRFLAMAERMNGTLAWVFSNPEATGARARSVPDLAKGMGLGLVLSDTELTARFELPLSDETARAIESLSTPAGKELVARLDPDAFVVSRFGGDPAALSPLISMLPRGMANTMKEVDLDLERDVLGNLKPGIAVSMSLAKTAQLDTMPSLDPRYTNPFKFLYLAGLGQVKDPNKATETLEKIAKIAPRFGSTVTTRDVDGGKVYVANYHLGEGASFALAGDAVTLTGGQGRMDALLNRLKTQSSPLEVQDAGAKRALEGAPFAVYMDAGRLIGAIRELPDSAYGIGGFAIKAAVGRWLDSVDDIAGLRLSGGVAEKSLRGELAITLKAPAAKEAAAQ